MAYQPINKPIPKYFNGKKVWSYKRDCEDFKPYFWNRRYCKLSNKCGNNKYGGILPYTGKGCSDRTLLHGLLCTGIKKDRWQEIIS